MTSHEPRHRYSRTRDCAEGWGGVESRHAMKVAIQARAGLWGLAPKVISEGVALLTNRITALEPLRTRALTRLLDALIANRQSRSSARPPARMRSE